MKICLIPARSGSKRIKNKNLTNLNGKPIIFYSIDAAINSKIFDKVIVTTDSEKIAKTARIFGAETPFIRPKKISNDTATDLDVLNHFVKFSKKNKIKIDYLCYLYPTAFLINKKILKYSFDILKKNKNCQKVLTICKFRHPIERALRFDKNKNIIFNNKKKIFTRTQDLPRLYYDAAQCYWYNINIIKKLNNNSNLKTKGFILDDLDFYDIDDKEDLKIAKKLKKMTDIYAKKTKNNK